MSSYNTGDDDERFEQIVSQSLHCCICTNVIKDPVICPQNEHLFCRVCFTRHLIYSQTRSTCIQPLTAQTLRQATWGIRLLTEEIVDLGGLQRHVADCGFVPVVCFNEGCQLEVNKQDLLHRCNDIRREMETVKVNLVAISGKLQRNEKSCERNEKMLSQTVEKIEVNVKAVEAKIDLVQEQLYKQEESNRQLKADNVEMKKTLNEITKQLERMTQQASHEVQAEQLKKGIVEAEEMDKGPKIIVAGGENTRILNSVEMFCLATRTWTRLQPMKERRKGASSVVYNNQFIAIKGWRNSSMEKLSLKAVHVDQSISWKNVPVELPEVLGGHCSVVYNGRLIVIGGCNDKLVYSHSITEISLIPPFTSKLLATMPQTRGRHGVAMFGDKVAILGGLENIWCGLALSSVIMYDITENTCQELAPLPYPVSDMATVKWDDDNLMIIGGADTAGLPFNKVLMYNIKTQKSHMLPDMKYKRKGCVAAVVKDTVIVMGGKDEMNYLNSVESFRFDRYTWEELPVMHEAKWLATAAVFQS